MIEALDAASAHLKPDALLMRTDLNKDREPTASLARPTPRPRSSRPPDVVLRDANAALLIHWVMLLLSGYKEHRKRCLPDRGLRDSRNSSPLDRLPGATTVRNGPVWYTMTPDTCQSPITGRRRPLAPKGSSYRNVAMKRFRWVKATLP